MQFVHPEYFGQLRDDVAVDDGSLMEWSAKPELPMTNPSVSTG